MRPQPPGSRAWGRRSRLLRGFAHEEFDACSPQTTLVDKEEIKDSALLHTPDDWDDDDQVYGHKMKVDITVERLKELMNDPDAQLDLFLP